MTAHGAEHAVDAAWSDGWHALVEAYSSEGGKIWSRLAEAGAARPGMDTAIGLALNDGLDRFNLCLAVGVCGGGAFGIGVAVALGYGLGAAAHVGVHTADEVTPPAAITGLFWALFAAAGLPDEMAMQAAMATCGALYLTRP